MEEGFALWANPSSPHGEGRKAKNALEDSRARIKVALGWEGEVIFTSGASEAAHIGMYHSKIDRRVVGAIEHDAVYRSGPGSHDAILPVGEYGYIGRSSMYEAYGVAGLMPADAPRVLSCLQHVNSETGIIIEEAGRIASLQKVGGISLTDCAQSAGKLDIPDTDMAIVSAHKLGGPIGIGALLVRDFNVLEPTGGHERGYRRGTENLPAVLGFAAALEAGDWLTSSQERRSFFDEFGDARLQKEVAVDFIGALSHPTMSAQALLIRLDAMGIAVSAGSACSSGTLKKSRVLDAIGVSDEVAARTIRVSLGWNTTTAELDRFLEAWRSFA